MKTIKKIITLVLFFPFVCLSAQEKEDSARNFSYHLRTNLLSDVAFTSPNIGFEIKSKEGFSLLVDYTVNSFIADSDFTYHSFHVLMSELRYYMPVKKRAGHHGHHFGVYAQLGTYDFMHNGKGYQCKPFSDTYSLGVCYGYTHSINRAWSVDFSLGVGYLRSTFDEYKPYNDLYFRTGTKTISRILPTRAEITLVWEIQ